MTQQRKPPRETRLIKQGDDLAVLLDADHLESVNATPETAFDVTCDGKSIILTPVGDPKRNLKIQRALDKVNAEHGDDLRRLAE